MLRHHHYCWSSNIFSKIVSKFYFTSFFIFLWENLVFYVWNHSSKNLSFLTKPSFFLRTFTSKNITVSTKNLRTWSAKNLLIIRSLQSLIFFSSKICSFLFIKETDLLFVVSNDNLQLSFSRKKIKWTYKYIATELFFTATQLKWSKSKIFSRGGSK